MNKYQEYFNSKKFAVMIWAPPVFIFVLMIISLVMNMVFESDSVDFKIYNLIFMPFFFVSIAMETLRRELRRQAEENKKDS